MYDTGGEAALQEVSRGKPILKNRVEPSIEAAVVKLAFDYPAFGQASASNEFRKQVVFILFLPAVSAAYGFGITWKYLTNALRH